MKEAPGNEDFNQTNRKGLKRNQNRIWRLAKLVWIIHAIEVTRGKYMLYHLNRISVSCRLRFRFIPITPIYTFYYAGKCIWNSSVEIGSIPRYPHGSPPFHQYMYLYIFSYIYIVYIPCSAFNQPTFASLGFQVSASQSPSSISIFFSVLKFHM